MPDASIRPSPLIRLHVSQPVATFATETDPLRQHLVNLGKDFYVRTAPAPVSDPTLIVFNQALCEALGLSNSGLNAPEGAAILGGNRVPAGHEWIRVLPACRQQKGEPRALPQENRCMSYGDHSCCCVCRRSL